MKTKSTIKKITATFLAMVMTVIILPFSASADSSGEGWSFESSTGKLTVSTNSGTTAWSGSVSKTAVKSVEITSAVTSIGDSAFKLCENLKNISIPNSVTSIGKDVFYYCTSLASVTIPNSVTSIGDYAFRQCIKMASVNFEENSKLTSIGEYAFSTCKSLTSITIPDSVTSIGEYVFYDSSSLNNVIVGSDNLNFYSGSNGELFNKDQTKLIFYPPAKLESSYIIPSSVTDIGIAAFSHCKNLSSITIPDLVTSIGDRAFLACTSLTSITVPDSVISIGTAAFSHCNSVSSITIPNSVTSLGESAFYYCTKLNTIEFLGNVPPIFESSSVFYNCTAISTIYVPDGAAVAYGNALIGAISNIKDLIVYSVTVNNGSGSGFFNVDDVVTVTAEPAPSGKVFDKWTTESTEVTFSDENSEKTTFTMPAGNVIVTATYKDKPVIPDPPSTGGSYTPPQPSVAGGTGWTAVNNAIAKAAEGTSISINLNGGTNLPKSVLEAAKGKDINLAITMTNGFVWTINGKDITDAKNIDLTVKKPLAQRIPTEVLNTVTGEKYQLYLGFEGDFGFKAVLTLPLGNTNNGRYANLFYFNPKTQKLEYISSGIIDSGGNANLDFSHASDYAITITSEIVTETIDKTESSATDASSENNPTTGDRAIPLGAIILLTISCLMFFSSCANNNPQDSDFMIETTTTASIISTDTSTAISEESKEYANDFLKELDEGIGSFYGCALFYDIDLDGNMELLIEGSDFRSFSTNIYYVYKLNNDIPEYYGRIDLESSESRYTAHTVCEGKLLRYYDNDKGVYVIISDATKWDDGSFGQVQYYTYKNTLYSDEIINDTIADFGGTWCALAKDVKAITDLDFYEDNSLSSYLYDNGIFDLNGTEKFVDISKETERYEFIDTVELKELTKHTDIDVIAGLITEYSGYEKTNSVLSPHISREYIEFNEDIIRKDTTGVTTIFDDISKLDFNKLSELEELEWVVLQYDGDEEITLNVSPLKKCKNLTSILIVFSNTSNFELKEFSELENLVNLHLVCFGIEEINIDLAALKKCKNLTSLSLPNNISESTKQQIPEFIQLEAVNMSDIVITSKDEFQYIKDLPNLKYVAIGSSSEDPDYFNFLYSNQSIEWIRFDKTVTDEQVQNILNNMPNIKAITFGFSEV